MPEESVTFAQLAAAILAIGALGTAAVGIVDATKIFMGGVSNAGFRHIEAALTPFAESLRRAIGPEGDWQHLMKSHWLNGRPKDEQKAIAKSLIRLGLSQSSAKEIAPAIGVDTTTLVEAAQALETGMPLTEQHINVLGRFDASVDARLDAGFDRADHLYRNAARSSAGVVALLLAVVGGGVVYVDEYPGVFSMAAYFVSWYFVAALLAGAVAVPVAPIAKDLVSALAGAVQAVKATKV